MIQHTEDEQESCRDETIPKFAENSLAPYVVAYGHVFRQLHAVQRN
jgi:hypothetical protein